MTGKSAFYLPVLLVFIAMEVIFAFSAFGFITIPPISITFLPALVLAGAFVLGPLAGAILGGIFGLASIWKASVSAVAHADQIFSPFISGNPLASLILSLGVRVLFGFVAGCLFFCRKNIQKKYIPIYLIIVTVITNMFHSFMVYFCIQEFFPETGISITYGVSRITSLASFFNYIIYVIIILKINDLLKSKFIKNKLSDLNFARIFIKSKYFMWINIFFSIMLLILFFGVWYHLYGRMSSILFHSGFILTDDIRYKFLHIGLQFLVTLFALLLITMIISIIIENHFIKLSFYAKRDTMTLLLNKNTFIQYVNNALSDNGASSYLLILDIDDFKLINDTYGHPVGDNVLIRLAEILNTTFSGCETIGRLGGDEFSVFVENVSQKKIESLANIACGKIARADIPGVPSVSCSIGVTSCSDKRSFTEAYRKADEALYAAKHLGKNRYFFL